MDSKNRFEAQKEILFADWSFTKTAIRDLDSSIFKIKGWAIAVFSATVAAAVTLKIPSITIVGVMSTFLFWWMDGLFKSYQQRFILRDHDISRYLNSSKFVADQSDGGISIDVALPFNDLQRFCVLYPPTLPISDVEVSKKWPNIHIDFIDAYASMRLRNVATLYRSLIFISVLFFVLLSVFAPTVEPLREQKRAEDGEKLAQTYRGEKATQ